jgi:hypothetical protein
MKTVRWLLVLLLVAGLSACTQGPPGDKRQAVIPLTVPAYPRAQRLISTPMMLEKNLISGTETTFDTTDTLATVQTWYSTTLQGMGWTKDITPEDSWMAFRDGRGCPFAVARIYFTTLTPGSMHVRVNYRILACRDWPPAPTPTR